MFFFPQVWSENSQDHDDFVDDALKILRGESSDMFPESIIDQLFKDTFESDIFLTSGDDFAMDPLFFLSPEFDHGVNSLWKDWSFMNWSPAVFQNVFITYFEQNISAFPHVYYRFTRISKSLNNNHFAKCFLIYTTTVCFYT